MGTGLLGGLHLKSSIDIRFEINDSNVNDLAKISDKYRIELLRKDIQVQLVPNI